MPAAAQYLVKWETKDHKKSIAQFLKSGHAMPAGITVVNSWHVVGEGTGYVLLETGDPKLLHGTLAKWADVVECTTSQVLSDADAKQALGAV